MSLLHIGGSSGTSVVPAEGVDFDGTYDYLSRSTDLVGNVDSKTFTFSAWVYVTQEGHVFDKSYGRFKVYASTTYISIDGYDTTTNNHVLGATLNINTKDTFIHIMCSIDLTNTSKRYIYVNDINKSLVASWSYYSNTNISFLGNGNPTAVIGAGAGFSSKLKGRLAHLFLDYTYRDLSIEANRRLFITSDAKPTPTATLKALNPILYLPMKDAATAHINEGTGGNFTANGTFATSNRGANQPNCTQLSLDGTADYLSRSGLAGTSSKELLISVNTKAKESATLSIISTRPITLQHIPASSKFSLKAYNSSNVLILSVDIPIYSTSINIEYSLQCSVDLTNTSNRKVQLNGIDITASCTWITYTNDSIEYSYIGTISIGLATDNQEIGELYLGNSYLSNLSSFWDSIENKPIPVRKVIADTGVTPLVAMPLDASNPGKNYGTGGDFTANSAPYVGARGASEFWARSAYFNDTTTTNKLKLTAPISSASYITGVVAVRNRDVNANSAVFGFDNTSGLSCRYNGGGTLEIFRASGTGFRIAITTQTFSDKWAIFYFSLNVSTPSLSYLRNSNNQIGTVTDSNDLWVSFPNYDLWVGNRKNNDYVNTDIGCFYFTTDYIDFSQEVNRLKFVDGLGYPLDLAKQIESGVIPTPLIYLPFNDPSNLGLNLGTGGNFTVKGTITQGADVNG